MKLFDVTQTREIDKATITAQGISSYTLMERAGKEVFLWIKGEFADKETVFHVFCGPGNNGGDGLVVARLLHTDGYTVIVNTLGVAEQGSEDFKLALENAVNTGITLNEGKEISSFGKGRAVVIDALFGIGLNRELNEETKNIITKINDSSAFVLSIDMPSGMYMDKKTSVAVRADVVLTFQYPKLPFFLPSNYGFVEEVVTLPIGLDKEVLRLTESHYYYIDSDEASYRYRPVPTYAHKGTQGHALIIGGSYGKGGATMLACRAALQAGCGLVTGYVPKCCYHTMQASLPEAMVITDGENCINSISFGLQPQAIAVGMGLGQEQNTHDAFHEFLKINSTPLVIDADGLNILSQNKYWLDLLPEHTILTPHPKELERLIGSWQDDFEKLAMMKAFSTKHKAVLVAKDARTMTVYGEDAYINSTGNAALATGGSGDVLTGIITGLLAQGYNPVDAAVFGVYIHGLTADIAVSKTGKQSFIASTITEYLGSAFLKIEGHIV